MFVTFEGPDGGGKSTQADLLVNRLHENGREAILVHEPGGTDLGVHVRALLVSRAWTAIDPWAEALLFSACRAQLVAEVIRPALEHGVIVVADRFADSTLTYQGAGRGLPLPDLESLVEIATGGLAPDVTVLLDVPPEVGLARNRRGGHSESVSTQATFFEEITMPEDWNRFEDEAVAFHRRIQGAYLEMAARAPERWLVIDATVDKEVVAAAVWTTLGAKLAAGDTGTVKPGVRPTKR